MRLIAIAFALAAAVSAQQQSCPKVWEEIVPKFLDHYKHQCGREVRAALRAVFHDCGTGRCDGGLVLASGCESKENAGIKPHCDYIRGLYTEYKDQGVGVADLIQFAGVVALSQCPLSPHVQIQVGRRDGTLAPLYRLPNATASAADQIDLFKKLGLSAKDLVALLGTHSVAFEFQETTTIKSLDTTPETMDIKYYQEVLGGTAPFTLKSDRSVAFDGVTRRDWAVFSKSTALWGEAFIPAWQRMATIGVKETLVDCTYLVPKSGYPPRNHARMAELEKGHAAFMEKMHKRFNV